MEQEAVNNLPLGVLSRLVLEKKAEGPYFLASVGEGDKPLLVMMKTQSHLILGVPEGMPAGSWKLAARLPRASAPPKGCTYPKHRSRSPCRGRFCGSMAAADGPETRHFDGSEDLSLAADSVVYGFKGTGAAD
ncbi:hypothetical protein VQ056_30085 [Paenibacillus sp. JTLBN-2024]